MLYLWKYAVKIPNRNLPTAAFHVYLAAAHVKLIRDERAGSPFSRDALHLTWALFTARYRELCVCSKAWSLKIAAGRSGGLLSLMA